MLELPEVALKVGQASLKSAAGESLLDRLVYLLKLVGYVGTSTPEFVCLLP